MATRHPITLKLPRVITPVAQRVPDSASEFAAMEYLSWVAPSLNEEPTTFTITEVLEQLSSTNGGAKRVYRATMHMASIDTSVSVILKIAMGRRYVRDLRKEAHVYMGNLISLLGMHVAFCYGIWSGETYEGQTAVMVLQDGGQPLRWPIAHQPVYFRQIILDHLVAVHHAGVSFGHFGEDHVVARPLPDGRLFPMLIGFGDANAFHQCPYEGDITVYSPRPEDSLPCAELWGAALRAEAFLPRTLEYFGGQVPVDAVKNPVELVRVGKRPDGIPEDVALAYADRAIRELMNWRQKRLDMDKNPVRLR